MKPLHPWTCLTCDAKGLTTVTQSDVSGEARAHGETETHTVSVEGMPA